MTTFHDQALAYLRGEMNAQERTAFEDALLHSEDLRAELESSRALLDMLDAASQESIVRQVNAHIQQAIRDRASDIHVIPGAGAAECQSEPRSTTVFYRIDGQLIEAAKLPAAQHRALVDRWKIMAEMNIAEQRVPQDGRILVRYEKKEFDLRVSVLPTVTGERVTARILDRSGVLLDLDKLGMDANTLAAVKRMVERPHGYVVLAGTAASGKTTFAYALLRHLQAFGQGHLNILTVEDPVEYQIQGISQTGVNRRDGMTYPIFLRSMMRSDPDVIYVGETRNEETAQLSIEAAVTGHIVLSQLHVASAIQTVQRLRDIGIVNHLLASNLVGAIGMRLVRRVCQDCAADYVPAARDLARAGLSLVEDGPFRRGVGCDKCRQTGYRGRIGLFEAWEVDDHIKTMIADKVDLYTLWQETFGRRGGSLWDDAREKIRRGLVTVEDVSWALFDYPHPRSGMATLSNVSDIIDLSEI
jgi:type II secretory ATPase GspE/PulE/Tfp pilus assembly ATPase PilB-like protein